MILTEFVKVSSGNSTKKRYLKLGYKDDGTGHFIIKVLDLPKSSSIKIRVKCDICGKEKEITFGRYNINRNNGGFYACSRKCANEKAKNTCKDKYGVENPSQLEEIKQKKIDTCMENFGVEHPQQSKEVFQKGKDTKLELYGDENYNNPQLNTLHKKEGFLEKYRSYGIYDIKGDLCYGMCDNGKQHKYEITKTQLYNRIRHNKILCTECNDIYHSSEELEMTNFIKEIYKGNIIESDRKVLNKKELDVYLPDIKMAFEYNGLYYHNELYRENDYHLNKTELCSDKGIHLIHVYSDEWTYKQEIVKSRIKNLLGINSIKIYGRKCEIKEIKDTPIIRAFLDKNHIQGYTHSKISYGLYFNDELVSLMTFGNKRKILGNKELIEGEYELLRFCNKLDTTVIGGASKLFKHFIKNNNFKNIISYADRSWSNGRLYEQLGFDLDGKTKPNYYYVNRDIRENRFKYRKDILVDEGFDKNKSEHDIMLERKIYRIYNSGSLRYIYNK